VTTALTLLAVLGALGAFDTLYYHEWKLRLPSRPHARRELALHAYRDFAYAVLFGTIGWVAWHGALAWVFAALLVTEIVLTLWDFIEEDRTRKLPPGERAGHAIMGILYGAFLAFVLPELLRWSRQPTGFAPVDHGFFGWLLTAMAIGVLLSGVRDLHCSLGHRARQPVEG
jgi:hypothetical protein